MTMQNNLDTLKSEVKNTHSPFYRVLYIGKIISIHIFTLEEVPRRAS